MPHKPKRLPNYCIFARSFFLCGLVALAVCLSAADALAKLVIIKAVYGDLSNPNALADVTTNVAAMVKDGRLNVVASNDNFVDPAEDVPKQLKVDYELDDVSGTKTVSEGQTLRISDHDNPEPAPVAASSRLIIRRAEYGDLPDGDAKDVTELLADMVKGNALVVTANPATFGDPAPDLVKQLKVDYLLDGVAGSKTIPEGGQLRLSLASKLLVIRKALYGVLPDGVTNDVTPIVAELVLNDALDVPVNKDTFGDPGPGKSKQLRVDYAVNGVAGSRAVFDGGRLRLSATNNPVPAPAFASTKLVIAKALYGNHVAGQVNDVTAMVAAMIRNNDLDVIVSNDDFGDPAVQQPKQLNVDYVLNGIAGKVVVFEGGRLKISARQAANAKLVVRKAVYGDLPDGVSIDVTTILAAFVTNDVLDIPISIANFGDPAPNIIKSLHIDYALDGKEGSATVREGVVLRIPAADK